MFLFCFLLHSHRRAVPIYWFFEVQFINILCSFERVNQNIIHVTLIHFSLQILMQLLLLYMLLYRCLRYFTCVTGTLLITLHYCTNVTLCDPVTDTKRPPVAPSRSGSRLAMPMAQATGVSLLDDLMPSNLTPKSAPSPGLLHKSSPAPLREYTEG